MKLTPRQNRFVAEYLVDQVATQAAIRAGFSAKTAGAAGARLLKNVNVAREIDAALKRRAERVEVKQDDVLRELLRVALVDVGEAFDERGNLKPLHEMSVDVRRALSGVEVVDTAAGGLVRKVKFWDKTRALEQLGRHLGLFKDKLEVSGPGWAELVAAASKPKDGT